MIWIELLGLFGTLVSSLGIVEVFKKILIDWYENAVDGRAKEIRSIANDTLRVATTLKLRDFDPPMTIEESDHFLSLAIKADTYDKEFGKSISFLVNWPTIAKTIKDGNPLQREGNAEWIKNIDKIRDNVNTLIDDCNRIRFSPSINLWFNHIRSKKT